jgi:hypothetical protein
MSKTSLSESGMPQLRDLNVSSCCLGNHKKNCLALASILRHARRLEILDVSNNELTNCDATNIASGLSDRFDSGKSFLGLRRLHVSRNKIGHYGLSTLGAACSKKNSTIETLDLSHNPLGTSGASFLSEVMKNTTTLRTLIVDQCQLGTRLSTDDGDAKGDLTRRSGSVVSKIGPKNAAVNSISATTSRNNLPRTDAHGMFDVVSALGYSTSVTALSVAGNWCGDDVQGMVRCSRVLARHLPKTQLTHLNISGVGLGCNGVAAIGTALRRASGADDVIAIERNHQEEMKRLLGVLQAEENREKLAIRKLQQIREYVSSEKKKVTFEFEKFERKNRSMVADIHRKSLRRSPVKTMRQEQAAIAKVPYSQRTMQRSKELAQRIDELEQLDVEPSRQIDLIRWRLIRAREAQHVEIQRCNERKYVAGKKHLSCHLTSLDVSWNVLKSEALVSIQAAAQCLEGGLSTLPSIVSFRTSGNKMSLYGDKGYKAIGRGVPPITEP